MRSAPQLVLSECPPWGDYALLDSGDGQKLERFGSYRIVRPDSQAMWRRAQPPADWDKADAVFTAGDEEEGGAWRGGPAVPDQWEMRYGGLTFSARLTSFRHLGVFPEQASQWEWMRGLVNRAGRPVRVLDLFGYTGLASLMLAGAGASVTYVDASKKAMAWARENQALSGMENKPIRWIVDDALKFVRREARRGGRYDGILMDPPKFGRGPKGEVWKLEEMLPALLSECRAILSERPLFVLITAYAIRASAVSLYYALEEMMSGLAGRVSAGELVIPEQSGGRVLPTAIFAGWSNPSLTSP